MGEEGKSKKARDKNGTTMGHAFGLNNGERTQPQRTQRAPRSSAVGQTGFVWMAFAQGVLWAEASGRWHEEKEFRAFLLPAHALRQRSCLREVPPGVLSDSDRSSAGDRAGG
jgi:hypothetical protein